MCGDPVALSAMEIEALKLPAETGVNVTVIVQLPPPASDAPQLLVWLKLPALVPVTAMLAIVSAADPGFDSVIGSAVAVVPTSVPENNRALGFSTAWGVGAVLPVPVSVTVWGDPLALSATERLAENPAAEAGENVTEIVQLDPAAREPPQVFV